MIDTTRLLSRLEVIRQDKKLDLEDKNLALYYEMVVANFEAAEALKQNPLFQAMLENFEQQIKDIDSLLSGNTEEGRKLLTSEDRKNKIPYYLAKKDLLKDFVEVYSSSQEETIKHIENRVDQFLT